MNNLKRSIRHLKGIGPKKESLLNKLGIFNVEDLLNYYPKDYNDRRRIIKIKDCVNDETVNLVVKVSGKPELCYRMKKKLLRVPVKDETGFAYLIFFNQPYLVNSFKVNEVYRVSGKVKRFHNQIQINNCVYEKHNLESIKIGKITPNYYLTKDLSNAELVKLMTAALANYGNELKEILPNYLNKRYDLISKKGAIENIHFPSNRELYKKSRNRLVFEELLLFQLGLLYIKNSNTIKSGIRFNDNNMINGFINNLPYKLTNAQIKVYKEINRDMNSDNVMNRLIQGDVGSGKTIIAILAMLNCVLNGYQATMMAPTEILAKQHYNSLVEMLSSYNINVGLLVGNMKKTDKVKLINDIKEGKVNIVIGTHALIQENIEFKNLGLSIIDEQHRFGVKQRSLLSSKGFNPDVLVMSATPIPRTLSLILYGDLDISIIDELPPGRKEIKTYVINKEVKSRVYDFVIKEVNKGRQAYIVCPLIDESESIESNSAIELYNTLKKTFFKDLNVGLLHGKMNASDKNRIMEEFKNNKISILITTTVIEVGVNVPNSNIMIIQNSERFGLAQLHQLRGRVGRGDFQSYCILINESNSKTSINRLGTLAKTSDGFIIAEEDLKLRGPGEILGTKQHGLPNFRIANIFKDIKILKVAQKVAEDIIKKDPLLNDDKHIELRDNINQRFLDPKNQVSIN